ncbi:MAG: putative membrane protein [Verrucomicrobiales bacterium]|jgi:uncharacterized membrane protein
MSSDSTPKHAPKRSRYLITGLLVIIPIGVTLWVLRFLFDFLVGVGTKPLEAGKKLLAENWEINPPWLDLYWINNILAVILVIVSVYTVGVLVRGYVGKKILSGFESILDRIPVVKTLYNAMKQLVALFNKRPEDGEIESIVLIDFPNDQMKAIGLVTRTMIDPDTGQKLAAVYVPTTPNPTNGYLEILPVEKLTPTDWTFDQAMTFVVSAGATAPPELRFSRKPATLADVTTPPSEPSTQA